MTINGTPTTAWYEINPATGEAIGVTEDGGHGDSEEETTDYVLTGICLAAIVGILYLNHWHPVQIAGVQIPDPITPLQSIYNQLYSAAVDALNTVSAQSSSSSLPPFLKQIQNLLSSESTAGVTGLSTLGSQFTGLLEQAIGVPLPGAPGVVPLSNPQPRAPYTLNAGDTNLPIAASVTAGAFAANVATQSVAVSGSLSASWTDQDTSSFRTTALAASGATVTAAGGRTIGTGTVTLAASTVLAVAVSGSLTYSVSGQGSLSAYGTATTNLGVSGDWTSYTAALAGNATLQLTTDALQLNGVTLPAGTYTIGATSATLSGTGTTSLPNFSGAVTIQATDANVQVGPAAGMAGVGGTALAPGNGFTLDGFTGKSTWIGGMSTDAVTLNGNAANVLAVSGNPATLTTDQNHPVSFQYNVLTSQSNTYHADVIAPDGWTAAIDQNGIVTITPPPGVQSGTYAIELKALLMSEPDFVAQGVVDVTIEPTQPGINFTVASDPLFAVPSNGAQLPTAFRASIQNLGPAADNYSLTFSNLPTSFTLVSSSTSVTVPAGQTGILGIYLQPNPGQSIPPPGTELSFTVTATSTSDPSITQTQTETFTVPAIDAVTVTAVPAAVSTTPGVAATDTLTLTNAGNVPENNVTVTATTTVGLSISGLAPVSLATGQTTTETVTLTPAGSTPLNSLLDATITATFGPSSSPQTQTLDIPVDVVVPGAAAIADASSAANQLGNTNLADRLNDLFIALTDLVQNPTSTVYQSQALANLTAVSGLLAADPCLAALVPTLTSDGYALAQATNAAAVQAAVTTLGNDLDTVGTTLSDEAANGFTLAFVGTSSQTAEPQVATTFQLSLQNTGSQTTTYDLSLSGLPTGVTGSLSQSSITLGPGQVTPGSTGVPNLTITLTPTSTTSLAPVSFNVTATAEGAAEITQSITGSLSARSALVQVTSATTNPPFTNPGGQVDVQAQILNAVNKEQQAEVSYTVTDASGAVVDTSTPVTTTLNVLTTLSTVDLGNLNTTGFALGDDTITVTVSDSSGNPIAGATGTGALLIGTPVTATLTTMPASLPAGSGTVTATLQANSQSTFAGPLALDGQTAIAGGTSVAVDGTLAYVGTSSDIDVVDISSPTKPTVLSTFGTGDFPAASNVTLQVYNGELVVLAGRNSATSSLLVYSLANPMSPSLLGQTPLTFNSGNDSYLGISSIANNQVYTSAIWYRFGGSNAIFAQFGESLDVDISNPAAPKVVAAIYNDPPVSSTGYPDGTSNIWQSAAVNNDVLLVGSTTATGSTANGSGVEGIVMVVDTSNPGSLSVLEKLPIPGMAVVTGIAVDGNQAFVIGSTDNFTSGVSGLGGNVVVATLDLTNPQSPTVTSTQTLNVASIGIGSLTSLGNNLYVTSSAAGPKNGPQILVFNAADPSNVAVTQMTVPASIGLGGFAASSNLLLTADGSNLLVYNLGQAAETPVTAVVTIPTGSGVSVVPGSFSIAPTNTVNGPSSETLEWNFAFTSGTTSQTITFEEAVTGLAAGQSKTVVEGGTVGFVNQGTPGTLTLPAQLVTGDEIIGLAPATQTEAPGAQASYTVNLTNPASSAVTYTLAVQGLPASWVRLGSTTVSLAAGGTASVPLFVTSDPFAATGDDGFAVTASGDNGATASVQGDLVLEGQPTPPDPNSHGIVASLTPAVATAGQGTSAHFVVQLTNTGSADDTFSLSATGLPSGVTAAFGQTTIDVPPGASNFRDVTLTLTSAAGTTPGSIPFQVTATSTTDSTISNRASGSLDVLASGVSVSLSPASTGPGSSIQETVTNTGTVADTFKLALGGPAALVSSLSTDQVTLAPGASQVVAIRTSAVNFADQGDLNLTTSATSTTSPAILGVASASLSIPSTENMTASFSPASQTLSKPGTASFLLMVHNVGNTQDSYTATIMGTSGPVTATLAGLAGSPTQSIPEFILPGLATGAILLQADLAALGSGTVTVEVKSLTDGSIAATATASVNAAAANGPRVTDVQRFGYHMMPTTVLLTFDQALDAATADNPRNYQIIGPGGRAIRVKSAVYNPSNDTVTLRPSQRISIHHKYTLVVDGKSAGALASPDGRLLDSVSGGIGSNYRTSLTWRNLVLDPPWPEAQDRWR